MNMCVYVLCVAIHTYTYMDTRTQVKGQIRIIHKIEITEITNFVGPCLVYIICFLLHVLPEIV